MAQNFDLGMDYSKDYLNKMDPGTFGKSLSTPSVAPSGETIRLKPLVSAYLDQQKKPEGIRPKTSSDNSISRNYKSVQAAAASLKNNAKEISKADPVDADGVMAFVDSFNRTLDSFRYTNNNSLIKKGEQMTRFTAANADHLAKVGIRVGDNNTLSADRDLIAKASPSALKSLFNENNSFGQSIAEKAGQIEGMSRNTVNKISRMYDGAGQYKAAFNPDAIINNYF